MLDSVSTYASDTIYTISQCTGYNKRNQVVLILQMAKDPPYDVLSFRFYLLLFRQFVFAAIPLHSWKIFCTRSLRHGVTLRYSSLISQIICIVSSLSLDNLARSCYFKSIEDATLHRHDDIRLAAPDDVRRSELNHTLGHSDCFVSHIRTEAQR